MNKRTLLEALARPFYMEPTAAQYYAGIVHKLFTGESITEFDETPKEFAFMVNAAGQKIGSVSDANAKGVAVINLQGAVMKYDYCGAPGTQTLMQTLDAANNNPAVQGIVLQIDSPGGSVDGTQQFANAVKNSKKPVVAYVNGMMASAAMWIGSAAAQRIASSNTDLIGSIGTMARWADFADYYKSMGIKQHEVYATDSTQKNIDFREAAGGNYEPLIKNTLDPLNNQFTSNVKQNLPGADATVYAGGHYIAKDAVNKGLVDKIGTFNMAVKTAMKLAAELEIKNATKMEVFQNVLKAAGAESFAVAEGGFILTEENINAVEAALIENATTFATQGKTLEDQTLAAQQASEQLTTAQATIAERDATIEQLQQRIAQLEAAPAGGFSKTTKPADAIGNDGSEITATDSVNAEAQRLRELKAEAAAAK